MKQTNKRRVLRVSNWVYLFCVRQTLKQHALNATLGKLSERQCGVGCERMDFPERFDITVMVDWALKRNNQSINLERLLSLGTL